MDHREDSKDCNQGANASGGEKRCERQVDPELNHHALPPSNIRNGGYYQQQPPCDFHQRPRHIHPCNGNTYPGNPPPAQWQYFMRHQPFGESARPYQFPPPPHFPPQFQFGTFPGRNSPRLNPWRENMTSRSNHVFLDGNLHNSREPPKDVRPKTGPFLNGRKKVHRKKNPHNNNKGSKLNRSKRDVPQDDLNGSSQHSNYAGEEDIDDRLSVSQDGDSEEVRSKPRLNTSLSCDGQWLNDATALVPGNLEAQSCDEGAVGGIPVTGDGMTPDACNQLNKDLIDEGAVFDLDNVFLNRDKLRRGDNDLGIDSESEDNLDYVYDFESKSDKKLSSSDDSECENGEYCGKISLDTDRYNSHRHWNGVQPNSSGSQHNERGFVNRNHEIKHAIVDVRDFRGNCHGRRTSNDLFDSDNGEEDTGDFIDTDLPSHTKHILSSSDELDTLSSGKESDEEEGDTSATTHQSHCMSKNKRLQSDVNCNDLSSSLHPNLLGGVNGLSMEETGHNRSKSCDSSNQRVSDIRPLLYNNCSSNCDSIHAHNTISNRPLAASSGLDCYNYKPHICNSNSYLHGAANGIHSNRETASCLPDHPGADSELPFSLERFHHHPRSDYNSRLDSSTTSHDLRDSSCTEHATALSATGGHCSQRETMNCVNQSTASGTSSAAEESGGCCCSSQTHVGQEVVNNLDVSRHRSHSHMANGFNEGESSPNFTDDENNAQQKSPLGAGGYGDDQTTLSSALATDKKRKNTVRPDVDNDNVSVSRSDQGVISSMCEGSLDQMDTVLFPMEEEIEPVHSVDGLCGSEAIFDLEEEVEDLSFQTEAPPSFGCEDCHRSHPVSSGNRLPSKEFYDLIKTVSATDSYMRFFDKDGQDVQRTSPKTSYEEANNNSGGSGGGGKAKAKPSPKSSKGTPKGDGGGVAVKVDRVMIWDEYEAYVVQYKQIAVSACGQTAILNVMKALQFPCVKAAVCKAIQTNLRQEHKEIPEYLFSRACAGTTAVMLMQGVEKLTGGVVGSRFFHFWPPRNVKLVQWLAYWMKKGAIPMATLNLQQGPHSMWEVPDSWHHQMVYGVSHQGLYLTNPLEIVSERSVLKQLHSDSVLLVRRQDITTRFGECTDLGQLLDHPDPRWMSMNVLGQVVNVLRECNMPSVPGYRLQVTSHVTIPAAYQAGITLFMRKDKPAWNSLVEAGQLPILQGL